MITSSCGKGTRDVHMVLSDQLPPLVPCHVCVAEAVNVMFVFPPQLPSDVPVNGAAAPAAVMSMKSTYVSDTAAAVIVRDVPVALLHMSGRLTTVSPLQLNVPVHV